MVAVSSRVKDKQNGTHWAQNWLRISRSGRCIGQSPSQLGDWSLGLPSTSLGQRLVSAVWRYQDIY